MRDSVAPDVTMLTKYSLNNGVIKVNVSEGSSKPYYLKVTSKNHSDSDEQTDFSSDCIEISQAYCRMSRNLCAR